MKFSTSLTAMVALAAASTTMAQQIKPDAMASSLINALKAANLTELATYATADSKAFVSWVVCEQSHSFMNAQRFLALSPLQDALFDGSRQQDCLHA